MEAFIFSSLRDITQSASQQSSSSLSTKSTSFITELAQANITEEDYINHLKLLNTAKSIWHLCEIFFIDPNENITAQLVDWLQRSIAVDGLLDTANHAAVDSDEWWGVIYKLVIHGRSPEARHLLSQHTQLQYENQEAYNDILEILNTIPSLTFRERFNDQDGNNDDNNASGRMAGIGGARSLDAFLMQFEMWQLSCRQCMAKHRHNPSIERLFMILLGDSDVLIQTAGTWYELLVARLLYSKPQMMKDEVKWLAETCLRDMHVDFTDNPLDECRGYLMTMDLIAALRICDQVLDIRWFIAHLTDLLNHTGQLEALQQDTDDFLDLREYFLVEYASTIMFDPSLWQVAADYLIWCPKRGRFYLDKLVQHVPLTSDRVALKLVAFCDRCKMMKQKNDIANEMGMKALRLGQYGSSIHWFLRSKNTAAISAICNKLVQQHMEHCISKENMDGDDSAEAQLKENESLAELISVVDAISPADITLCNELAFLPKYRDLCLLKKEIKEVDDRYMEGLHNDSLHATSNNITMNNNNSGSLSLKERDATIHQLLRTSMEILVRVLLFEVAPRKFWPRLLLDVVPLLERGDRQNSSDHTRQPILSANDTYKLMACLEEITLSHDSAYLLQVITDRNIPNVKERVADAQDKIQVIRLAMTRNLARAAF